MATRKRPSLSSLEDQVMQVVWDRQRATADEIRNSLADQRPLKDSTVRTVLRRLEEKGYVTHTVEGRTFQYVPKVKATHVASDAIRSIIDRLCNGSVEALLVGMVDDEIVAPEKLRQLAEQISRAETESSSSQVKPSRPKKGKSQ